MLAPIGPAPMMATVDTPPILAVRLLWVPDQNRDNAAQRAHHGDEAAQQDARLPPEVARHLFVNRIEAAINPLESAVHSVLKPADALIQPRYCLSQAADHLSVFIHRPLHPRDSRLKLNHDPPHLTVVVDDDAIVDFERDSSMIDAVSKRPEFQGRWTWDRRFCDAVQIEGLKKVRGRQP